MHFLPVVKHKWRTFIRLSRLEKQLFFINFFLCGNAKLSIYILPYRFISLYFGRPRRMLIASTVLLKSDTQRARFIGRSVRLAAKYTPWDSSCLTQAMVAKFWCVHYKIAYLFFVGFDNTKPLGQSGHAWVTAGPIMITGGYGFNTHHVVLT